jgi:hypothetical protein
MPSLSTEAPRPPRKRKLENSRHFSKATDDFGTSNYAYMNELGRGQSGSAGDADPIAIYVDCLADTIVANALAAAEATEADATLGDLSRLGSALRSTIIRAGQSIPDVIARALAHDERLIVLREYLLPLTRPAAEIVDNNRSAAGVELAHDRYTMGSYRADLVVIDSETRHATVIECRRGSVSLSTPKTGATVRLLRIAGLTARRALEADNYRTATISCGVIDRYGNAGYAPMMTVGPDMLDDFFGVPIVAYLDRLDDQIRQKLMQSLMPALSALAAGFVAVGIEDSNDPHGRRHVPDDEYGTNGDSIAGFRAGGREPVRLDLSRMIGPVERRTAANRPAGGSTPRNVSNNGTICDRLRVEQGRPRF